MSSITSSLEGLQRAEIQIADSAKRLSRLPASFTSLLASTGGASSGEPVDIVDISAESVALLQGRNAAEANIAAFRTFGEVQQQILRLLN